MDEERTFPDPTLLGNEIIEEAIRLYYEEQTDWRYMGILMALRSRMRENGHLIFPADVTVGEDGSQQFGLKTMDSEGGPPFIVAFTSQEEFAKAPPSGAVSNFIDTMLEAIMQAEGFGGITINPWGQSVAVGKEDIAVIVTPGSERFI